MQAANRRKTFGLLMGMGALMWCVVYAALSYFGGTGAGIVPIAVGISLISVWGSYYGSDKLVLTMTGAKLIQESDNPKLFDLIPNLVETVKGYAKHEQSTFDAVVTARAKATTATTVADTAAADGMLTQALRGLLAVAEAYPDLKASANFMSLQEELATTENKVAFSRQFYNDNVRSLNTAVKTIPSSFFAGFAKVSEREFYEVEDPQDRNVPNVSFN